MTLYFMNMTLFFVEQFPGNLGVKIICFCSNLCIWLLLGFVEEFL